SGKICACMAMLRTLSILLSLLVPAHTTRSPDCGGILTPSGLRYLAEVSKPHAESVLRRDLMDSSAPAPSPTSPSSRNQIISVKVDKFSLTLIPDTGMRLSIEVDLGIASAPSATKEMRLSILADLHVDMNPEENLELVTSDCKPTLEEVQSTEQTDSKSSGSDVDKQINVEKILPRACHSFPPLPEHPSAPFAAPFPITPNCQVQYLPLAAPMYSEQGIIISLQTTFQVAGAVIPLPVSPVPFSMPEPARSSPSHLILAFSEHFYTSLFSALEESGALNVSLLSSLTTATLAERITQMGSLFQEDLPVVLQAVSRSSPHVVLEEDKAIVQLFLTAQIGAGPSLSQSFLSVNVVGVEVCGACAGSVSLLPTADPAFSPQAALLEELFLPTIREEVPAQINKVLRQGVFLPHIASFTYTNVNITIHKVRNKTFKLLPAVLDLKEAWEQC
uniref:Lipid-binding serum glycoprotein C-terminal domain-containing protein n=1 Tax=Serinus canaria TaxID=9135 RepID=A0A8C9NKI3_SERCA